MKKAMSISLMVAVILGCQIAAFAEEKVLYSFERGMEGWEIPDWAYEKGDYVGETLDVSKDQASEGKSSLKLTTNFMEKKWQAAIVEIMEYLDFTPYTTISCDVMVPENAPKGMKAKIVLTVGDDWKWTEMSRAINLEPGKWITLSANLRPGSIDWKRTNPDDEFRADVRKIDIRIEYNRTPGYNGALYIDNIRVE